MPSYRDFVRKARERMNTQGSSEKKYAYTRHAEYKMREYRLSRQKVEGVIRRPHRVQEGVAKDTVAVMQPVSPKTEKGKQIWKQEVWVMYQRIRHETENKEQQAGAEISFSSPKSYVSSSIRIISAWRYPGMSRSDAPLPEEILTEIAEGNALEDGTNN